MRPLAYLLIVGSLVAGSLAATTAYAPRVGAVPMAGEPLTLAAPAGRDPAKPDHPAVSPGDAQQPLRLTPEVMGRLAALNVERVRVKEFAIGRWDHAWIFGLAMIGLVLGGFLLRREAHQIILAQASAPAEHRGSPQALLDAAHDDVEALLRDVVTLPREQQAAEIIGRVDAILASHVVPFIDSRNQLMGRYGGGGFARLMDPFAAAERQLNRAWSAAADGAAHESIASLENARVSLASARARLTDLGER